MRTAILDIGSNSAHLKIVDLEPGEPPLTVRSAKRPTRLAESLTVDGRLGPAAAGRLGSAVSAALELARRHEADELIVFATSALRDAADRDEVVARLAARTGVEPAFLSGEDEARLTFLAARAWHGWSAGPLLLADIGGGSLEIAAGAGTEPDLALSLRLGAGRLTRERLPGDPPRGKDVKALRRFVRARLAEECPPELDGRALATSKIFTQLAKLIGETDARGNRILRRKKLRQRIPKLAGMDAASRARLKGVTASRARQIVAGAVVAEAVMDHLGLRRLEICPWALREGIAVRRLQQISGPSPHGDDISHLLRPLPEGRTRLQALSTTA